MGWEVEQAGSGESARKKEKQNMRLAQWLANQEAAVEHSWRINSRDAPRSKRLKPISCLLQELWWMLMKINSAAFILTSFFTCRITVYISQH